MLSTQNYHDDSDLAVGQNPGNLVPWFKSKLQGWLDVHPKVSTNFHCREIQIAGLPSSFDPNPGPSDARVARPRGGPKMTGH